MSTPMAEDTTEILIALLKNLSEDVRALRKTCDVQAARITDLSVEIASLKGAVTTPDKLEKLEGRVRALENAENKVIGGWKVLVALPVVASGVTALVTWLIVHVR